MILNKSWSELKNIIAAAVKDGNIIFKKHALVRMLERNIETNDIIKALECCTIIEEYDDDKPFPSCLVLGYSDKRPLHIVLSCNIADTQVFIITIYEPSPEFWNSNFMIRRRKQ